MVIDAFGPVLAQLDSLVAPVTALKATADGSAGSVSPQDVQDTVTEFQTKVSALALAAGQPAQ